MSLCVHAGQREPTLVAKNLLVDVFLLEAAVVNFLKFFFIFGEGTQVLFIFCDNFFKIGQCLSTTVLERVLRLK